MRISDWSSDVCSSDLTIVGLRSELHELMESAAGIYREDALLREACKKVAALRQRYRTLAIDDHSMVFNTQLFQALELGAMLDIGEAMVHAALARRESRGAHQRLDFPEIGRASCRERVCQYV